MNRIFYMYQKVFNLLSFFVSYRTHFIYYFGNVNASGTQDAEVTKSRPEWIPLWRVVKVKHCTWQQFRAPQPHTYMYLPHIHLCFTTNEFNLQLLSSCRGP